MTIGSTYFKTDLKALLHLTAKKLIFLLILLPHHAFGLNSDIGVTAGYDDNVNLTHAADSSAFTRVFLSVSRQRLHNWMYGESLLFVDASYRKFARFNDEFDLMVGGHYSCLPMNNALVVEGFFEGGVFRDREVPEDEFNWAKTGFQLKYQINDKVRVNYIQAFKRRSFLEPVEFVTEVLSGSGPGPGSGGSGITEIVETNDQNDLLISSDFTVQINVSPRADLDLTTMFGRLYSSIDADEFKEMGVAISLRLTPAKTWLVTLKTSGFKQKFVSYKLREDRFSSSGLIISKMAGNFEVFAGIDYNENNSTIDDESYRQRVAQCGLTCFF